MIIQINPYYIHSLFKYKFKFTPKNTINQHKLLLIINTKFLHISKLQMQNLDENSPQIINESYKIWKKNVPALYNILHTYQLESCSQSVQWLNQSYIDNTWKCMNLLIGTNSLSNNAVYLLNIYIPTDQSPIDVADYSEARPQLQPTSSSYIGTMGVQNVDIKTTLHQDSQVMKIKLSKANPTTQNMLAVKTGGSNPQLIIYNLTLSPEQQQQQKICLKGHQAEGYGLAWNNLQSSILASCSYDKKLLVYDIAQRNSAPIREINTNEYLEDVKWTYSSKDILCTASQSKTLSLYDLRDNSKKPILKTTAHSGEIYALDFNKYAQNLLLSGAQEGEIYLWDVRNMSKKFNSFVGHGDSVTSLQWSPYQPTRFISSSVDRKVVIWDIDQTSSQITSSVKQSQNKTEQISFIHNGHRSKVTDVNFSAEQNLMASCQQNNVLQVWQTTEKFWGKK